VTITAATFLSFRSAGATSMPKLFQHRGKRLRRERGFAAVTGTGKADHQTVARQTSAGVVFG
jgi:hypothetical protein